MLTLSVNGYNVQLAEEICTDAAKYVKRKEFLRAELNSIDQKSEETDTPASEANPLHLKNRGTTAVLEPQRLPSTREETKPKLIKPSNEVKLKSSLPMGLFLPKKIQNIISPTRKFARDNRATLIWNQFFDTSDRSKLDQNTLIQARNTFVYF